MPRQALLALISVSFIATSAAAQFTLPDDLSAPQAPADPVEGPATPAPPAAPAVPRSQPRALPVIETVPQARDIPWTPGNIRLEVDATDTVRRIVHVTQTIPVTGTGPLTLLLPEWLPGKHDARGTIEKLAGLTVTADGQPVEWRRDPLDVFAFHISVPQGASSIVAKFQFLPATASDQGRIVMTDSMFNLQWESVSLYPAGFYTRNIPIQATVRYPAGWTAATALRGEASNSAQASTVTYAETDYETLVDSPVFAGRYARAIDLGHDVTLNIMADDPAEMLGSPEQIDAHRKLIDEAVALFGARHFDHYDFLFAISDKLGSIGLEHQRSSENRLAPGYFKDWAGDPAGRNLLPHELVHSWNGKYRRPEMLWTPDFSTPMQDDLLWVYEGQTQFWGYVLGARSGLYTKQQTLDALASIAGRLDTAVGREWRPLHDTTFDPIISKRRPKPWASHQRSEDYYNEGLMIWLEADGIMRGETFGAKGMDDFAKVFFGMNDGDWGTLTYNRQDVIEALNSVVPYDWASFLRERVDRPTQEVTKAGFALGGYRLVYTDTPGATDKSREASGKNIDQSFGVGLVVGNSGDVEAVVWKSPAFEAGVTVGSKIVSVNGEEYSAANFRRALGQTTDARSPLSLILKQGTRYRTISLDYSGGIRYPRLEKTGEGETSLDRLLEARTGGTN